MKIRIKGNSVRLRLTQREVNLFGQDGSVTEETHFPDGSKFVYALSHISEGETLSIRLGKNQLEVLVPNKKSIQWVDGADVSMEAMLALPTGDQLHVLIEKDFQCLKPRAGEDESDNYPNPLAAEM